MRRRTPSNRKQDLSSLLEGCGWAINLRMRLNSKLRGQFTTFGKYPKDAKGTPKSRGLLFLLLAILAVLLLGMIYHPEGGSYAPVTVPQVDDSISLWALFSDAFPTYIREIANSLLPIVLFFAVFQLVSHRAGGRQTPRPGAKLWFQVSCVLLLVSFSLKGIFV